MFVVLTTACRRRGTSLLNNMRSDNLRFHLKRRNCRAYVGWAILTAYLLFLVRRFHSHDADGQSADSVLQGLQNSNRLVEWVGGLALSVFWEFARFAVFGFLATIVIARGSGRSCRIPVGLQALAVSGTLTVLVCLTKSTGSRHLVGMADLAFPLLGCLFGAWAGTTWLCGWRARLWFILKGVSLCLLAALGTDLILWLSLEEMPLPFEAARVTSVEKRRLVDLIPGKSPGALKKGQTHTVRLTEHDINVLLSWGLSLEPTDCKAKVSLDHDCFWLLMSAIVPVGGGESRYLNLEATGGVQIEDGVLNLRADRCRIGSRKVPRWLLASFGKLIASRLNRDPQLRPFLHAATEIVIEPNLVQLAWRSLDLPAGLTGSLLGGAVVSEELLASTRAQADNLLILFAISPELDPQPSFNLCLATAFALARSRSIDYNPVVENQAAILALGVLTGHPRMESFIGPVLSTPYKYAAQRTVDRVVLRDRSDWARHFCVSAAITVLSQEAVSDAAGLLKEELDADEGGSGFSFADLLADRAGTAFAISATRDEAAARSMQDRLAGGFDIEEVFPPVDGLPEGISDAELKSRYGGVGGEGYCRLIDEIKRRISTCAAYP
ncbi:MAG: hypothetical protein ACYSWQ_00365 [Planctomycetota bacterium]|jgi:hypothetical protein